MYWLLVTLALAGPSVEDADSAYAAEQWEKAAEAYGGLAKKAKTDARLHYRHAWARHQLGEYAEAAEAYAKAAAHGAPAGRTQYNRACALAHTIDADGALLALEAAVDAGFAQPDTMLSDPELESLRGLERFKAAVQAADALARPCRHDDRFRAFDFWVGSWDVVDRAGNQVGTNEITLHDAGCTILEQWSSARGITGTSINRFHPGQEVWMQDWMGQRAGAIHYEGRAEDGGIRFTGTSASSSGAEAVVRAWFAPQEDGTVVQHLEQQDPETGEWRTSFYGIYRRRE